MSLITIVTEGFLKDRIADVLRENGTTGFTITRAAGEGSRGINASDWEGPNLRFESLCSSEVAQTILNELSGDYFEDYAVVAWISQVEVLRSRKFLQAQE